MQEVYQVIANDDIYATCLNRTLATRMVEEAKKDLPGSHPIIRPMNILETPKDAGLE